MIFRLIKTGYIIYLTIIPDSSARRRECIIMLSMERTPSVYLLASKPNGTLYIGVTSSLIKRIWEHKNDLCDGFTKKYRAHMLVWYELHQDMENAIKREKQLKKWNRQWKIRLIREKNPTWQDLYETII